MGFNEGIWEVWFVVLLVDGFGCLELFSTITCRNAITLLDSPFKSFSSFPISYPF